ncbi:MAG: hypothetical protein ABIJ09_02845 [Pseudomonadota bacterium]
MPRHRPRDRGSSPLSLSTQDSRGAAIVSVELAGDCRVVPGMIVDKGQAHPSHVSMWVEAHSGLIVAVEPFAGRPATAVLAAHMARGLRRAREREGLAGVRLRVADAALAAALRRELNDAVEVRVGPVPELDDPMNALAGHLGGGAEDLEPGYLSAPDVTPALVGEFFAAAAGLYRQDLWRELSDNELFVVDVPDLDANGLCSCVIGQAGESYGVLLYPTARDYIAFYRMGVQVQAGRVPELSTPLASWLAINFDSTRELSATQQRELRQHRWPVAGPAAHPHLIRANLAREVTPPSAADYCLATAVAAALTQGADELRRVFTRSEPTAPRELLCLASVDGREHVVHLTMPHPEGEAILDALDAIDDEEDPSGEDPAHDVLRDQAEQAAELVTRFELSLDRQPDARVRAACGVAMALCLYKLQRSGSVLHRAWTAELVQDFLRGTAQELRGTAEPAAQQVPEFLLDFVDFLHRAGRVDDKRRTILRKRIEREAPRYRRELGMA